MGTFGNENSSANYGQMANTGVLGSLVTTPADAGVPTALHFYANSSYTGYLKGAIWKHSDLSILAVGSEVLMDTSPSWRVSTFTEQPALPKSTEVVLGVISCPDNYKYVSYTEGTENQGHDGSANYVTPGTLTVSSHNTNYFSIHCEYTPAAATLEQEGYRWRLDDNNEANATPAANQDANITAPANSVRRLRVLLNSAGDVNAANYQLEYKEANDANYTKIS